MVYVIVRMGAESLGGRMEIFLPRATVGQLVLGSEFFYAFQNARWMLEKCNLGGYTKIEKKNPPTMPWLVEKLKWSLKMLKIPSFKIIPQLLQEDNGYLEIKKCGLLLYMKITPFISFFNHELVFALFPIQPPSSPPQSHNTLTVHI